MKEGPSHEEPLCSARSPDRRGIRNAVRVRAGVLAVIVWALSGPIFDYSSRWQLVINTGTTVVTFLMVFLIQNAQNHDQAALQLKLDELIRGVTGARTGFVNLEDLTEDQIDALREEFRRMAEKHEEDVPLVAADFDEPRQGKSA
ncbi:MAG TPA: low affinity iron permease family protein [Coriobacteriia bacterium]|nr:low affinity iron permease family protein [Coriobacteriia bacterium]